MSRGVHRAAVHNSEAGLGSCILIDTCGARSSVHESQAGDWGGNRLSSLHENPNVFIERRNQNLESGAGAFQGLERCELYPVAVLINRLSLSPNVKDGH